MRLILADDHILIQKSLSHLLTSLGMDVVALVDNGDALLQAALSIPHDLILSDYRMPGKNTLLVFDEIKQQLPSTKILAITGLESLSVIRDIISSPSIDGAILKSISPSDLTDAIQSIVKGDRYIDRDISKLLKDNTHDLTKREVEIALLLTTGANNTEIAQSLTLSVRTVENHRRNIMQKLHVSNIVQLLRKLEGLGLNSSNGA